MTASRLHVRSPLLLLACTLLTGLLCGCESTGSAKRNLQVTYRFENLRKSPTTDEWAAVKAVLDRRSVRSVDARPTNSRTIGNLQLFTYEARVVLPSVRDLEQVQIDLEALARGSARPGPGGRVEVFLTQLQADYRTNFVAATTTTSVSGVAPRGHRVRVMAGAGLPAIETRVNSSGVWRAELPVVPPDGWVYGVSEDPEGVVPSRFFRLNVSTKAQERVDEAEFRRLFPADGSAPADRPARRTSPTTPAPAVRSQDDRQLQEQRRREEEELKRRREQEQRRRP